jgi:hypothetical protein
MSGAAGRAECGVAVAAGGGSRAVPKGAKGGGGTEGAQEPREARRRGGKRGVGAGAARGRSETEGRGDQAVEGDDVRLLS